MRRGIEDYNEDNLEGKTYSKWYGNFASRLLWDLKCYPSLGLQPPTGLPHRFWTCSPTILSKSLKLSPLPLSLSPQSVDLMMFVIIINDIITGTLLNLYPMILALLLHHFTEEETKAKRLIDCTKIHKVYVEDPGFKPSQLISKFKFLRREMNISIYLYLSISMSIYIHTLKD